MKKLVISALFACSIAIVGIASQGNDIKKDEVNKVEAPDSRFKIVNDTDEKVKIHTGYGTTTLNPRGGSTSVSCTSRKKVKVEGDVIFEITSDLCGTTVKLSEYL